MCLLLIFFFSSLQAYILCLFDTYFIFIKITTQILFLIFWIEHYIFVINYINIIPWHIVIGKVKGIVRSNSELFKQSRPFPRKQHQPEFKRNYVYLYVNISLCFIERLKSFASLLKVLLSIYFCFNLKTDLKINLLLRLRVTIRNIVLSSL